MFIYVDFIVLDDRLIKYNDCKTIENKSLTIILDSVNLIFQLIYS